MLAVTVSAFKGRMIWLQSDVLIAVTQQNPARVVNKGSKVKSDRPVDPPAPQSSAYATH